MKKPGPARTWLSHDSGLIPAVKLMLNISELEWLHCCNDSLNWTDGSELFTIAKRNLYGPRGGAPRCVQCSDCCSAGDGSFRSATVYTKRAEQ